MNHYLGIDLGTSATKALILDEDGLVLAKGRGSYEVKHPQIGWSEQGPDDWWQAVCDASRQAVEAAGHGDIAGVALSGQLNGLVLLDKDLDPLTDALIWLDQRASEEAAYLNATFPELLRAAALNPASPIHVGAKLLWLRRHRPDLLNRSQHILLAKDYINYRLTGVLSTDESDASNALLRDLRTSDWIQEVLDASGVNPAVLPEVHDSVDPIGTVSSQAAAQSRIPAGAPVMAGSGDVTALAVGSGAIDDDVISVTLGTAGHVVTASDTLTPAGYRHIWQMRHAIEDRYIRLGLVMSGGLSLAWLERELGEHERQQAASAGRDAFEALVQRAAASEPGARGALFLPFLEGAATPFQNPHLKAAFLDINSSHAKADLVQAVLEGVAFNIRDCVELFEELGTQAREVRLSEGGSRSDAWCQVIADVLQRPVVRLRELDASALGAAMIAMSGDPERARNLTDVVATVVSAQAAGKLMPNPTTTSTYEASYERYRELAEAISATTPTA